jgi:uncharacterized protein (DUF58 family)
MVTPKSTSATVPSPELLRQVRRLGNRARRRFVRQAEAAREERRRSLASLGVDVVEIPTDGSYVAPLLSYFQARTKRR